MIDALSNGLNGMLAQQANVDRNAGRIAGAATSPLSTEGGASPSAVVSLSGSRPGASVDDLAANIVGMKESVLLYEANARTVKAADEMLATLLEARA